MRFCVWKLKAIHIQTNITREKSIYIGITKLEISWILYHCVGYLLCTEEKKKKITAFASQGVCFMVLWLSSQNKPYPSCSKVVGLIEAEEQNSQPQFSPKRYGIFIFIRKMNTDKILFSLN